MTNRDRKACNKAIAEAWKREKELVLQGKGTRDWTEEQQLEIIELGKAFDDDGIAFEGQHMKSVAAYPEYQGDPLNIQLLSRSEHLAAHKGNFQNPTNWYYDSTSFTFTEFGDNPPIKIEPIELSIPIAVERSHKGIENVTSNSKGVEASSANNRVNIDSLYAQESLYKPLTYEAEQNQGGFVNWIKDKWEWVKENPWKAVAGGALFAIGTIWGGSKAHKAWKAHTNNHSNYSTPTNIVYNNPNTSQNLMQNASRDIGKVAVEKIQQSDITSTLTKQALDSGVKTIVGLSDYSSLLAKGYNTNVSEETRHQILANTLSENGGESIIRLLRFLISTRSGNKLGKYEKAISVWKDDLDFVLKEME